MRLRDKLFKLLVFWGWFFLCINKKRDLNSISIHKQKRPQDVLCRSRFNEPTIIMSNRARLCSSSTSPASNSQNALKRKIESNAESDKLLNLGRVLIRSRLSAKMWGETTFAADSLRLAERTLWIFISCKSKSAYQHLNGTETSFSHRLNYRLQAIDLGETFTQDNHLERDAESLQPVRRECYARLLLEHKKLLAAWLLWLLLVT